MSSVSTRTQIKDYLAANTSETTIDISGEFRELLDLMEAYSIAKDDDWIAIQFVGNSEEYISVPAGCYREYGSIFMHVVAAIRIGSIDGILSRCETIRSLFRGKRINDIIIESVSPPNTEVGTTLEFDNNFISATFFMDYYRDIKE